MAVPSELIAAQFLEGARPLELAARFGVTRQRIYQIVEKETGRSVGKLRPRLALCVTCGHPSRLSDHISVHRTRMSERRVARFWSHVEKTPGCWEYRGSHYPNGYAHTALFGARYAHRAAYVLVKGPIPAGLQIDHLCRNRGCVNPDHLEAVTLRENLMRSPIQRSALNARKTHCLNGHPLPEPNAHGRRVCLECKRLKYRSARGAPVE